MNRCLKDYNNEKVSCPLGGSIQLGDKSIKASIFGVETMKELSNNVASVNNELIEPYNLMMKKIHSDERKLLKLKYFNEFCNRDGNGPPRFKDRSKVFDLPDTLKAQKSHNILDVKDIYKKNWGVFLSLLGKYQGKSE